MATILDWCKFSCSIFAIMVAMFLAPLFMYKPVEVSIDDVAEWGLKGPGLPTLKPSMRGMYFLTGNQSPGQCNATEKKDKVLCRGNFKRSPFLVFDPSYCTYDEAKGKIVCHGGTPWVTLSAHPKHKITEAVVKIAFLFRFSYTIFNNDPEFAARPPALEGSMKLYVAGVPITTLVKPFLGEGNSSYRITMTSNSDGSRIERRTWWRAPNTPQPLSKSEPEWDYVMKRFSDEHGNVDKSVVREIKAAMGETLWILKPQISPLSALAGLLSMFFMDSRFIPAM